MIELLEKRVESDPELAPWVEAELATTIATLSQQRADVETIMIAAAVIITLSFRPWDGTEIYFNPELMQGFGLSGTLGVAGFQNGEAQKSDFPMFRFNVARVFLRQTLVSARRARLSVVAAVLVLAPSPSTSLGSRRQRGARQTARRPDHPELMRLGAMHHTAMPPICGDH